MIKIIFLLVITQDVLSAPQGIPFLKYGLPNARNSDEKGESSDGLFKRIEKPLDLPGTRNLDEKSIPADDTTSYSNENYYNKDNNKPVVNLPGTRNLDEKSIPESITLKKIPIISYDFETPRYAYDGQFIQTGRTVIQDKEKYSQELVLPKETEYQSGYKIYPYPPPTSDEEGSEIKEAAILPSPAAQPIVSSSDKNQINIQPGSSIKLQDDYGQYSHGFSNPDGTQVQESGHLISTDDGWEYVIAKEGSYSYISPEGLPISVRYIADENGFRIISQNLAGR